MALGKGKTEHAGAKRCKGYWGTKREAKDYSSKARRLADKRAVKEG